MAPSVRIVMGIIVRGASSIFVSFHGRGLLTDHVEAIRRRKE